MDQQGKIQTSTKSQLQNKHSEQNKKVNTIRGGENGKAEYELGEKYFEGDGVPQDLNKAIEYYRKAAEQGHAGAQYQLGWLYTVGLGVPQDYAEGFKWYSKSAEQGNLEAKFSLGEIYYYGRGVPQNYAEAFKWYIKSSIQGGYNVQYKIGLMYYHGQGVPQDFTKAAEWYRKAAKQDHVKAQFTLGRMYEDGRGVPEDLSKAAEWYRKAAEQGHIKAQFMLGVMYENGYGVPKDLTKSAEWYLKAAEQGHVFAQYILGDRYYHGQGVPKDLTKAVKWYRKAAEQGQDGAQFVLGGRYYYGQGVPKDLTKAAEWYRKAADQDNAKAQLMLGVMYENGYGVPKNLTKAVKWYQKAAEQGQAGAHSLLGELLGKTKYPGWEYLTRDDTSYFFINKNKIRRQGNLVWYWIMKVPFLKSYSDKKCTKLCWVADCNSAQSDLVSYVEYDSNGKIIYSNTIKKSEVDLKPVVPGSTGEQLLEYACLHTKTGNHKKKKEAKAGTCFGTGWSVSSGFVVTNNHVIKGRNHITLIRPDGVKIPARVVAHDAFNDLALLKVEDPGLLPAALPISSKPAVLGEKVVTIGYPHPDILGVKPKLTEGVVNSTSGLGDDPRALQISVPVQGGNSGGPLINMRGQVVGVVTSKINAVKMFKWTHDLPQNINYAIKISYLNGLLSSVSSKQHIKTVAPFKYISTEGLAKKIRCSVLIIMAN